MRDVRLTHFFTLDMIETSESAYDAQLCNSSLYIKNATSFLQLFHTQLCNLLWFLTIFVTTLLSEDSIRHWCCHKTCSFSLVTVSSKIW